MARIVLMLENKENLDLLEQWLSQYHSVGRHVVEEPFEETCDLCIVDGPSLRRFKNELQCRRTREQPGILPVLLLTTQPDVWTRSPDLWRYVDDSIMIPVSKLELQARIEILLRARHLSMELKLRNEDLEAFIQAMSHDLQASVRAVTMFAGALDAKLDRLDEEARRDLQRIYWAAAEMRDLIDSLLNFSRLGRGEIQLEPLDLRSFIESCVRSLEVEIAERGAQVRVKGGRRTIRADPALLRIALMNLLSNAIKFTPQDVAPEVTVYASVRKNLCKIRVNDNGIGVAAEDQQRIFMPFVRLHPEEDFPGIGLGLSSVRKAVELMGGRTGVDSIPGRGSSFWIEIPA